MRLGASVEGVPVAAGRTEIVLRSDALPGPPSGFPTRATVLAASDLSGSPFHTYQPPVAVLARLDWPMVE